MTNTPVNSRQGNSLATFKTQLDGAIGALEKDTNASTKLLNDIKAGLMISVARDPLLLQCDRASIFSSLRLCVRDGLVPDGQDAALVRFNTKEGPKVQYLPMVRGQIKRIIEKSQYSKVSAHVIYSGEVETGRFEVFLGDKQTIYHKPLFGFDGEPKRGDPVGVYAIAANQDGEYIFEVLTMAQVEQRRKASPTQRNSDKPTGVWGQWWDEMAKKSAIHALSKRITLNATDYEAVTRMSMDEEPEMRDITEKPKQRLASVLTAETSPQDEVLVQDQQETEGHWVHHNIKTDDAFPGSDEWTEGVKAFQAGAAIETCPYNAQDQKQQAVDWLGGFKSAEEAASKGGDE